MFVAIELQEFAEDLQYKTHRCGSANPTEGNSGQSLKTSKEKILQFGFVFLLKETKKLKDKARLIRLIHLVAYKELYIKLDIRWQRL